MKFCYNYIYPKSHLNLKFKIFCFRTSEFLGCMSFGVRHVMKKVKTVNGYYYLLQEDIGRRKHLKCINNKPQLKNRGWSNFIIGI